jgi:antitoxin FitA
VNLTIKDLPGPLHKKLKARAQANKRSLNWEVIAILESAIEKGPIKIEKLVAELDQIHARLHVPPLSDDLLRRAKLEGRR